MDIRDLYQELVLEHGRHPRNFGALSHAQHSAKGVNPLCGDKLAVYVELDEQIIKDVSFDGCGCAISMASASLMTEALKGKSLAEVHELFSIFHQLMVADDVGGVDLTHLGKLQALAGVRDFPMRVKCATLAWHTLNNALNQSEQVATTE